MAIWVTFILIGAWVFYDAHRRGGRRVAWALGTAVAPMFVLPFYFAKRPLRAGEVREGGTAWNVLRNFAFVWTVLVGLAAMLGVAGIAVDYNPDASDAEAIGTAFGTTMGMLFLGVMWFFPFAGAVAAGLMVRKSSVVERGPDEPLA